MTKGKFALGMFSMTLVSIVLLGGILCVAEIKTSIIICWGSASAVCLITSIIWLLRLEQKWAFDEPIFKRKKK